MWEKGGRGRDLTNLVADVTWLLLVLVRVELFSKDGEVRFMGSQTCCKEEREG